MRKDKALRNKRRSPRYPVSNKATAFLGDMQGEIHDVGHGGLGVRFKHDDRIPAAGELKIQMNHENFYLCGAPVTVVSHRVLEDELVEGKETVQRYGLVFEELTPRQRFKLDYFAWLATGNSL